jgi:DNA ligase (NAD+)
MRPPDEKTSSPHSAVNEIADLERQIRYHNRLYWDEDRSEITDPDYDKLVARLKEVSPDSPVLAEMGPTTRPALGSEFRHTEPMLSLDKCYDLDTLTEWAETIEGKIVAMPKFDGIACALHYDASGRLRVAATRGNGQAGEDITANALGIGDIPPWIPGGAPLEVRGEVYMRLSLFAKFKAKGMANPRNLTAGAVKQKDASKSAAYGLSFAAYELLRGTEATVVGQLERLTLLGFPKIDFLVVDRSEIARGFEQFERWRPTLDYEIDGVVFKADSVKEQRRLGQTSHHPRFAIAYKFQGEAGTSTLLGVEWSVARTGAITPVAVVEPVFLSGVTVTRASLHNAGFIDKLGLTLGAKVTLVRRGGVIPNVERVIESGSSPVLLPDACPSCGSAVERVRDVLYCTKPSTCRRAVIGQLAHYASTLEMQGFGDVILEQAYDAGLLRTLTDLYTLDWESLAKLERLAEKSAKKLVAEVNKKRTVPLATFLRALGLPELGKHVSVILAARYRTLEAVQHATVEELANTHSIGDTIANTVVQAIAEAQPVIFGLLKHVTVQSEVGAGGASQGPLSGKSFVFTGKMVAFSRSEGEKRVRTLGGAVQSSVSRGLDFLVVGADKNGPKSAKEKAADKVIEQGAPLKVISENELLAMLGGDPELISRPVEAPKI